MFYDNGSVIKKSVKKIDFENTGGKSLMAKAMARKKFNNDYSIGTSSMIQFHDKHFFWQNSDC